jgi:DNA-binding IclR family transcriptional regulator
MVNDDSSWRRLKTVDDATAIIRALSRLDGAGVTELSDYLDISKSSVHSHLATLRNAGFLVKEGDDYRLSYEFLLLGEYIRSSTPLYEFGKSKANDLAAETGHYAHLYVEEMGLGINIYEAQGARAGNYEYQSLKLQQREPLHVTASGKAVLAHLSAERVDEIVEEHGLERYTENTITDEEALFDELERIREQGYAVNDEEEVDGFRAVAAPIRVEGDRVLGSISVSGPRTQLSGDSFTEELPERVLNASNLIQIDINMSSRQPR